MKFEIKLRNNGRETFKIEGMVENLFKNIVLLNFLAQFLN